MPVVTLFTVLKAGAQVFEEVGPRVCAWLTSTVAIAAVILEGANMAIQHL